MKWFFRNGVLVPKPSLPAPNRNASGFPAPRLSRLEPYESPVTGKTITSWRERDHDLETSGSYDARDMPNRVYEHGRKRSKQP
jgi:hypothetical protein